MKFQPTDLGYFTVAVALTASLADGFGLSDIELVPWAWQIIDGAVNCFGWVALLHDRRRVYLRYRVDEANGSEVTDLRVQTLERGLRRPEVSDPGVHWVVPRHVNRALDLPRGRAAEQPEDLRELAKRTRYVAAAVAEPDKSRMLSYADELEEIAAALEQETVVMPVGVLRPTLN